MELKTAIATIKDTLYVTELQSGSHTIYADEPVDNGGKDLGPGPGDFLRMSLASCTAITLRMYANRKKFDVHEIEVKVSTEDVSGKTIFHREINIKGNLDEQQHKRMMQIANACPVHKVLTNPIEIETNLMVNP
ncbi:MAG TPA: OsmC family protein [Cyclobacteriaceae bacterium]|nr:OsmC family protein [Cyclobacteriaceae bacterium]